MSSMMVIFNSTYTVMKVTWHLNCKYNCKYIKFLYSLINSYLTILSLPSALFFSHECDILSCKFSTSYCTGFLTTSFFISKRGWIFLQNYWHCLDYTFCWDLRWFNNAIQKRSTFICRHRARPSREIYSYSNGQQVPHPY